MTTETTALAGSAAARQKVRAVFERVMNGGETELVHELAHPDFVNHEADPERRHGADAWAATREHLRAAFGDVSYELLHVLVDGDLAAAHVTMRGTHEGGIPPGMPATHLPFEVRHVHLFRFAGDGRIVEHWAVRDDLGLVRQVDARLGRPSSASRAG
jgi:predicted ester cyclase